MTSALSSSPPNFDTGNNVLAKPFEVSFASMNGPNEGEKPPLPLPAILKARDLSAFLLLTVVLASNTTSVQSSGPAAFFYWILGSLTFLIPVAYTTQWMARRFPGQGGPYLWAIRILGPQWGFTSAFCAWLAGSISTVAAIAAYIGLLQAIAPAWFTNIFSITVIFALLIIAITATASLPLRHLKHILLGIAVLYMSVFILQGGVGIWWLASGHRMATNLTHVQQWLPSSSNSGTYGIVILALIGINIPLIFSGEIAPGHGLTRVSRYVWWGGMLTFIGYIAATFGIMVVVPAPQAANAQASVQIIQMVLGSTAGNVVTAILALSYAAVICLSLLMLSRFMAIAAHDNHLPLALTHVNRFGVPLRSILLQGGLLFAGVLISYVVVPSFFPTTVSAMNISIEIYNIQQAVASIVWMAFTMPLLLSPIVARYKYKSQAKTTQTHYVFLWLLAIAGCVAALIGMGDTLFSSWIPNLVSNKQWFFLIVGLTLLFVVLGWVSSTLPHMYARLHWQQAENAREVELRQKLQSTYEEQEILILQQNELLAEVDRLYREQAKAAITDAITGLPNHRAVMTRLDEELARCARAHDGINETCAILFVDLDHFKSVNDTWGHRAGDAILREIADRLRATLRLEDFVGRYGGEEFAIVLVNADMAVASQIAERLRVVVATQPCIWQGDDGTTNVEIAITTSIGVSVYGLHGTTREALIEQADQAMYYAKRGGRNRVCVADIAEAADNDVTPVPNVINFAEVGTVQALTAAASARDEGTHEHAHRMVMLADATARQLYLSDDEIHLVRLGALLHDIGKIGIPDAILHKPGPLTSDEWVVMRRHPEIGQQILTQAGGVFSALASVVVAHHERWDGGGYPAGVKGEDIPLAARILTVIDSYDAMISPRVYKKAMPIAATRTELQRCAGSQYDPHVVEAFLRVLDIYEQEEKERIERLNVAIQETTAAV